MGRKSLFETFWEHFVIVPATGCWEWTGARFDSGYGMIYDPRTGTVRGTHVVAFELHHKLPPQKGTGVVVRHVVCDNPPCGFHEHLAAGTTKDNHHDAMQKGRHTRGEKQAKARLTEVDVAAVKTLLTENVPQHAIAAALSVHRCTIADVAAERTWNFVAAGAVPDALRNQLAGAVRRCACGCGRTLTAACKYGYAWECPNRPSQYDLRAADPSTYRKCEDCELLQPPFARGLCRTCYLERYGAGEFS